LTNNAYYTRLTYRKMIVDRARRIRVRDVVLRVEKPNKTNRFEMLTEWPAAVSPAATRTGFCLTRPILNGFVRAGASAFGRGRRKFETEREPPRSYTARREKSKSFRHDGNNDKLVFGRRRLQISLAEPCVNGRLRQRRLKDGGGGRARERRSE